MKLSLSAVAAGVLIAGCGGSTPSSMPVAHARRTVAAASCAAASPGRRFALARLVFLGRMLPGPSTSADGRDVLGSPAKVRVVRYLKGSGPRTVEVTTAATLTGSSGTVAEDAIEPQAGEIWKIYTGSRDQPFETSICGGSTMISAAQAALVLWDGFPAQARRRPIVPLGRGVVLDPRTGFPDGATKLAYLQGRFALRARLPQRPARIGRFPIVSAFAAYKRLTATGRSRATKVPPLVVRTVDLGTATFVTDRGLKRLPAWRFSFEGVAKPASVLALARPALFTPPPLRRLAPTPTGNSIEDSATANRSGTTITISFVGAPPGNGPCDARYTAGAVANNRAVALTITTITTPATPAAGCTDAGYPRAAVLHLARPLGARVLISSSDGAAIPVTR